MTASKKNHEKQQSLLCTLTGGSLEELELVNKTKTDSQHVSHKPNQRENSEAERAK